VIAMVDIVIPKNYMSFMQAHDFRSLCQPLLSGTDVAACFYVRLYRDGSYFHFSTSVDMDRFMFLESKLKYNFDIHILDAMFASKMFFKNKNENKIFIFVEDIDNIGYWSGVFKEFNIKTSFNIVEKVDDYYESFWFVSRFSKSMYSFCVNHYDVLENFILYFRENNADLIKMGEKRKIVFLNNDLEYCKVVQGLRGMVAKEDCDVVDPKAGFKLKKYPIGSGDAKTYLTLRELECLQYLAQGFSYKGIGNILQVSHRTIETHLQRTKDKLAVHSNSQLLKIYHASVLVHL
jgi:LuxR family transcriptional regulator, quorum-sensing system regulator SolR